MLGKLRGKPLAVVRAALDGRSRDEIAAAIFSLLEAEPHYSPDEIAALSGMSAETIKKDIRAGLFGGEYYQRAGNQLRVSASGVAAWRAGFRVPVTRGQLDHPLFKLA